MSLDNLTEHRLIKTIEHNQPSQATVLARINQVELELKTGREHANKVVIILLDDSGGSQYYFVPYSAGLKPSEAAFLCNMGFDAFKGLILPR